MKKIIQLSDKYIPIMDWFSETYDKEEFNFFIGRLLSSYKSMKEKNIDLLILSELLVKYDMDIYKLIQILENQNAPVQIQDVQENSLKQEEKAPSPKKPEKKVNPGILDLGIDLSS